MHDLRSAIREFCSAQGLKMNTDLGQHFLVDEEVLRSILEASELRPGDRVVEVGAGMGILTKQLLLAGADLTSIEIDERWIPVLRAYLGTLTQHHFDLVRGDALQVQMPKEPYRLIANIPYRITSPLLRHVLLDAPTPPRSLTLLLQREVAERICETKEGNLLGIAVRLFGTPRIVRHVPPSAFLPPPKVDSAVIHVPVDSLPRISALHFERVLDLSRIGFSQKRKMLRNTIGKLAGGMELMAHAGISPDRRPQTLSLEEWIALAEPSAPPHA